MCSGMRIGVVVVAALCAGLSVACLEPAGHAAAQPQQQAADAVTVKAASEVPIVFDGNVSKFEYGDASHMTFQDGHGMVDVYVKRDDGFLCFAFELPDPTVHRGDDIVIMLDTQNRRAALPGPECIRAYVRRKPENSRMQQGSQGKWRDVYAQWQYRSSSYAAGWEVECRIPLEAIPLDPAKPATMGLAFRVYDNEPKKKWNWPAASDENKPETWGTIVLN